MILTSGLTAAAVTLLSMAAAPSALPKQRTHNWIVDFGEAQCVAQRNYGSKDAPLYLVVKQPPVGDVVQLSIVRRARYGEAVQMSGSLEFAGSPRQKVSVLRYTPTDGELGVVTINLPLDKFGPARQATSLRLRAPGLDETFALEKMPALLNVMETCVADLRTLWNVRTPNSSEGGEREDSKGSLAGLFSGRDYPGQAIANMTGGTVKIGLLVDESGKVADCSVVQTSGVAVLDAQSCIIVKLRAKFKPAIGRDGKPTKQAFLQSITWRIR